MFNDNQTQSYDTMDTTDTTGANRKMRPVRPKNYTLIKGKRIYCFVYFLPSETSFLIS